MPAADQQQRQEKTKRPQNKTYRGFGGMNLTDSRLSVEDQEPIWLDTVMPVGKELQSIPLYNGDIGAVLFAGTVKFSASFQLTYGAFTEPHPVIVVFFTDGSAWQRDVFADGAVDVQIGGPGTFPGFVDATIWQDGPVLIVDNLVGYFKWNGALLQLIDATKLATHISVFEGRAWLLTGARTIEYTAPNTFDDFVAGDGAGAFRITDDAFQGKVWQLYSTVQQLWILGANAIDALGNVNTTGGITTFSVSNAVNSLGSIYPGSVIGYFRLLVFSTGYSIHALLGVTPQKLSAKIDRLFQFLSQVTITDGPRAGACVLNGASVLAFLFDYFDPQAAQHTSMLVCFTEGKWFLTTPLSHGDPPRRILDMVSVNITGTQELFGIDSGGYVFRLFARSGTDSPAGTATIRLKLWDADQPLHTHTGTRVGLDLVYPNDVNATTAGLFLVSEAGEVQVTGTTLAIPVLSPFDSPIGLRYAMVREDVNPTMAGQRIAASITLPCVDRGALAAVHIQEDISDEWDRPVE